MYLISRAAKQSANDAKPANNDVATAAQRVLAIPELLSEILINAPFEDIMRSRGVNRTWLGVIDTCPRILWDTWRSATPPKSARKQTQSPQSAPAAVGNDDDAEQLPRPAPTCDFEPFKPFFEKTLINVDEWISGIRPSEPPARIVQRQFIKASLQEFIAKHSSNLKSFYITRPPLQKIESSIKVITSGRSSLVTSSDRGFVISNDDGITVDTYLQALLECLETSWGTITLPPVDETIFARNGTVVMKKHRLETQLLTMKKEWFDPMKTTTDREDWENGVMSSTLIIKVQVSSQELAERQRRNSWWTALYNMVVGRQEVE